MSNPPNAGAGPQGQGAMAGPQGPNSHTREARELYKVAPRYRLGQPWDTFYHQYKTTARTYDTGRQNYKEVLYRCFIEEAALMVKDLDPELAEYVAMSGDEYADQLQNIFEPAAESEQCQIEFEERHQRPGELPDMYYNDKLRIFKKAYRTNTRDYNMFYNRTITGLINNRMKESLREYKPLNPKDFGEQIVFLANVQRRRYQAGEISEAEVYGAEARPSNHSYLRSDGNRDGYGMVKKEYRQGVYALQKTEKRGMCFYCGLQGHFIAECPRKLSGLKPTVNQMTEEEEEDEEPINYVKYGQSNRARGRPHPPSSNRLLRGRTPIFTPSSSTMRPNRQEPPKRSNFRRFNRGRGRYNNRRVVTVYDLEDGSTVIDQYPEEEFEEQAVHVVGGHTVEGATAQLEAVHLNEGEEEEEDENNFYPSAFLGM